MKCNVFVCLQLGAENMSLQEQLQAETEQLQAEKSKSLQKLKTKHEAMITDLEGKRNKHLHDRHYKSCKVV